MALLIAMAACTTSAPRRAGPSAQTTPGADAAAVPATPRRGGYYKDDGPGDNPPPNLDALPDAVPRLEPLHRFANRPYVVFGREYVPATSFRPYRERGIASWYGRKFHNEKTSTGEIYDMYAMTAAHPTLPLPSYARVTNLATGASVVVRVNDRGPFHPGRIVDLSYAAAHRLGIAQRGSAEVEVEGLVPGDTAFNPAAAPLPPIAPMAEAGPPPPIPVRNEAGGFMIQLGAFANFTNARAFMAHVQNQISGLGVETRVPTVHEAAGLYRVVLGPYATREDARRGADRLRAAVGLDATVRMQ